MRNLIKLNLALDYVVTQSLTYKKVRRVKFLLDYSSETIFVSYVFLNLGIKISMQMHMHPLHAKMLF